MKTTSVLRIVAALALLVAGLVHLQLYFAGYRSYPNPNLGRSFLANAVVSGMLSAALLVAAGRLVRSAAVVVAVGSLVAFAVSRTSDRLFGFREQGFSPSPQAALAVVAELTVVVLLGASFLREPERRPTATAPMAAAAVAVAVSMSGFAAIWAHDYGSSKRSARPVAVDTTAPSGAGDTVPESPSPSPTRTSPVPASTPPSVAAPTQTTASPEPVTTVASTISQQTAPGGVDIADFAFAPASITVDVGTTVTWINLDAFDHSVVAAGAANEAFDSGTLEPNDDFTHTFTAAGEYAYVCGIHPYMSGTVVVAPSP